MNIDHDKRAKTGGASEVGALFDCHPFQSEYGLWALKCGLTQPQEDTERLNAGRFLEPAILAEFNLKNRRSFRHNTTPIVFSSEISATPDGIELEDDGALVADVKTVMPFMIEKWKDGTPEYIKLQLQQQMMCAAANRGVTIAMFGFSDPRHEWIEADKELQKQIVERWATFWKRVRGELPAPDVDGHRATAAALGAVKTNASVIELGPEVYEWSSELATLEAKAKATKPREAELKNKIRAALGTNSTGVFGDGSGWRVSIVNRKESVTKASSYSTMKRIKGKDALEEDFE